MSAEPPSPAETTGRFLALAGGAESVSRHPSSLVGDQSAAERGWSVATLVALLWPEVASPNLLLTALWAKPAEESEEPEYLPALPPLSADEATALRFASAYELVYMSADAELSTLGAAQRGRLSAAQVAAEECLGSMPETVRRRAESFLSVAILRRPNQ